MQTFHAWTSDREWLAAGTSVEQLRGVCDTMAGDVSEMTFVTFETKSGEVVAHHIINPTE
jgi:hypothetical protein